MKTEIVCILDMSGSMGPQRADTIGGFNSWLDEIANDLPDGQETNVSVTVFDTSIENHVVNCPIEDVPELGTDGNPYMPRGGTALLDAVGRTLKAAKARVKRGSRGIAVIITDGEENSSHEWTTTKVGALISELEATGRWSIVYLGQDFDAWANAQTFAPQTLRAQTFSYPAHETAGAYTANARAVSGLMHTNSAQSTVLGADTAKAFEEIKAKTPKGKTPKA